MKFGPKEIKELNQFLKTGRNRKREFVADLTDDLEPGSLKDELLKDFDPSQETYEEYLQRKSLERPFNMANGGRIPFEKAGEVKKLNKSFLRHGTLSDDPDRLKKINEYWSGDENNFSFENFENGKTETNFKIIDIQASEQKS